MIVALAGGVGGAKLAHGLAQVLGAGELTIVVNTGDDFEHLGFHISPDVDTVTYTLAGRANPDTGWGLAGETWRFMEALEGLGGETWFRLGDQDLATHVRRTAMLAQGATLSAVTAAICRSFGVAHTVVPMSDQPLRTVVHTAEGALAFQDYFVRRRCAPVVRAIEYAGCDAAQPAPDVLAALRSADLRMIVICPSNPYLSIGPILAVRGLREELAAGRAPIVAVSPIVGGAALKGPAAKMMRELGADPTPLAVARLYADLVDGMVLDRVDAALAPGIAALACETRIAATVMTTSDDRAQLAREVLRFGETLGRAGAFSRARPA